MPDLNSLAQLGGTAVVAIIAIWALVKVNKVKQGNGEVNELKERLGKLELKLTNDNEHRFANIEKRLGKLETLMGEMRERIGRIEGWHNNVKKN